MRSLKQIRSEKHITLAELASKVGASASYISHIETGRRRLPYKLVTKIAAALSVPEAALREFANQSQVQSTIAKSWISQLKINEHPIAEAFRYWLITNPDVKLRDEQEFKHLLTSFIMSNLQYSITAELESNKRFTTALMNQLKPTPTNDNN